MKVPFSTHRSLESLSAIQSVLSKPLRERNTTEQERLIQLLTDVPLFASLKFNARKHLSEIAAIQQTAAGDAIVEQGERGQALYILLKGSCEIQVCTDDSKLVTVATLTAGEGPKGISSFGAEETADPDPNAVAAASVLATEQTVLLVIKKSEYHRVRDPAAVTEDVHDCVDFLRSCECFKSWDMDGIQQLAQGAFFRKLPSGTVLWSIGDPLDASHFMPVVRHGELQILARCTRPGSSGKKGKDKQRRGQQQGGQEQQKQQKQQEQQQEQQEQGTTHTTGTKKANPSAVTPRQPPVDIELCVLGRRSIVVEQGMLDEAVEMNYCLEISGGKTHRRRSFAAGGMSAALASSAAANSIDAARHKSSAGSDERTRSTVLRARTFAEVCWISRDRFSVLSKQERYRRSLITAVVEIPSEQRLRGLVAETLAWRQYKNKVVNGVCGTRRAAAAARNKAWTERTRRAHRPKRKVNKNSARSSVGCQQQPLSDIVSTQVFRGTISKFINTHDPEQIQRPIPSWKTQRNTSAVSARTAAPAVPPSLEALHTYFAR